MKKLFFMLLLPFIFILASCTKATNIEIEKELDFIDFIKTSGLSYIENDDSFNGRRDGVDNPFVKEQAVSSVFDLTLDYHHDLYNKYFDNSIYTVVPTQEASSNKFYVDSYNENNEWKVKFFSMDEYYYSSIPSSFVDDIFSNGVWSYALNAKYIGSVSKANFVRIFYAILNSKSLPYNIYYDEYCIYFMSKDKKFDQSYLNNFKNYSGSVWSFSN